MVNGMGKIKINHRIVCVSKPHWMSNPPEMSNDLLSTVMYFKRLRRLIQKIIIEVDKPTEIHYIILPGRWIERAYDSGFLMWGTL